MFDMKWVYYIQGVFFYIMMWITGIGFLIQSIKNDDEKMVCANAVVLVVLVLLYVVKLRGIFKELRK